MIPNTATSLWFSVSSTFTITSPCSIDAIRAESSPMRCWRNVASLAGGCCACSGTPTVAPQPARATQPSSLIPPLARTCTICPPLPRTPSRPTDATSRRPGHVLFPVHLDQLKEVRHRQRPNGETEKCLLLRPHERAEFERSHEQRDTSHECKGGDQSHDRGERDRGGEQREHRRDDAQDAERRRPAPVYPEPLLQN